MIQLRISNEIQISENFYKTDISIIFPTFSQTDARARNQILIEHESWYAHKVELQYDIYYLNVTKLVTMKQNIIET